MSLFTRQEEVRLKVKQVHQEPDGPVYSVDIEVTRQWFDGPYAVSDKTAKVINIPVSSKEGVVI